MPRRDLHCLLPLALVVFACACGGSSSPTEPDPGVIVQQLSERLETAHYVFHFSPGDAVDAERQEAFHVWATEYLGATPPGKLQYFKYLSASQMQALTGRSANGFAEPERLEVHSLFPWHSHETAHVYTFFVGRPSDFFNEGIAVAMSVDPLAGRFEPTYSGGISVHDWSQQNLALLPPIDSIMTTRDFRAVAEAQGYQHAGSFLHFLAETYGVGPLQTFFTVSTRDDPRERIRDNFESAFGLSVHAAEARWRAVLGG